MTYKGPPFGWTLPAGHEFDNLGKCRSCGADIAWCFTRAGKRAPVNPDGTSHFATCPQAETWRKKDTPVVTHDVPPPSTPGSYEKGMEGSELASRKWTPLEVVMVDQAIERLAVTRQTFTSDDIWAALPAGFPITKGLAGRLNRARHRGLIEPTGETVRPQRTRSNHGQRLAVWRSLVYRRGHVD